ncbi:hypothetical protein [Thermoactinomyces sp. DSM 45892]|uniref:hypothetical protein n=1 Tax=Thermoactinomyces sp. DSM 45892 TaxID=1882753 RepID=UPI000B870C89|nr:hypothetical protein [Thermoactinomyces sp. DSM 45892]
MIFKNNSIAMMVIKKVFFWMSLFIGIITLVLYLFDIATPSIYIAIAGSLVGMLIALGLIYLRRNEIDEFVLGKRNQD